MKNNKLEAKVSWRVFIWAIGIILLLFGFCFTQISFANNKADNLRDKLEVQISEIQSQLTEISVDVKWIKKEINNK